LSSIELAALAEEILRLPPKRKMITKAPTHHK